MVSEKKPNNPFQQLGEEHVPPDRIRKKVMTSVKFSQMMLHILDLYFNKTVDIVSVLVNTSPIKK